MQALRLYGKDWDKIQEMVGTRDAAHCRSHAQKFLIKLQKNLDGKSPKRDIENAQIYHDILSKRIDKPNRKYRFMVEFDRKYNEMKEEATQKEQEDLYLYDNRYIRVTQGVPIFRVELDQ